MSHSSSLDASRARLFLQVVATAAVAALSACGGNSGDGGGAGGPGGAGGNGAAPTVSGTSVGTARYSQPVVLTVSGSNLDSGDIVVNSPACGIGTIQRSAAAPFVSTSSTAYYTCTVAAVGPQQFTVTRIRDNQVQATPVFTVEIPQVTMVLDRGPGTAPTTFVMTLSPQQAPVTVLNFLGYVNSGFYTNTVFHRNTPGYVLQGGGYTGPLVANSAVPAAKATRDPIPLEVNRGLSNLQYTVAMARTNIPDSATSQFYINLVDNTFLDTLGGGYAVFGSVTAGGPQVVALSAAPCAAWPDFFGTGGNDCLPTPNITIASATQTR